MFESDEIESKHYKNNPRDKREYKSCNANGDQKDPDDEKKKTHTGIITHRPLYNPEVSSK